MRVSQIELNLPFARFYADFMQILLFFFGYRLGSVGELWKLFHVHELVIISVRFHIHLRDKHRQKLKPKIIFALPKFGWMNISHIFILKPVRDARCYQFHFHAFNFNLSMFPLLYSFCFTSTCFAISWQLNLSTWRSEILLIDLP